MHAARPVVRALMAASAALAFVPATLHAQSKWFLLSRAGAHPAFSMDTVDFNLESPGHVGGWFRLDAKQGARIRGKRYAYLEAYVIADCDGKTTAIPQQVYYSAAGDVVSSFDNSQLPVAYSRPVPDSYGAAQLTMLCSFGLPKAQAAHQ